MFILVFYHIKDQQLDMLGPWIVQGSILKLGVVVITGSNYSVQERRIGAVVHGDQSTVFMNGSSDRTASRGEGHL